MPAPSSADRRLALLTGATGYVGGRLLAELQARGIPVRCLARRPEYLRHRAARGTELLQGDVFDCETLAPALRGVDTAYYLIHSMGSTGDFEHQDRLAAQYFADAAREAGVRRIVYLGGLGRGENLSKHLASRQEVGRVLRTSGAETIEFRASIIVGSGSLSFEMIRALVEKLPVMITPRWVRVPAQPIAIEDVIAYLVAARDVELDGDTVFEIGGADRVTYAEIMLEYARQRGLRRLMIPVPVLTPRLSSLWLGLVTPVYARIGRKLIDSLPTPTVVHDDRARHSFGIRPRGIREAIERALQNEEREFAATRWSDAISSSGGGRSWGGIQFGPRIVDSRRTTVAVPPSEAFRPIRRIGGRSGWYFADWLWSLRGFIDLLVGGVGVRRGRRDAEHVAPGDAIDFWRVETIVPDRRLRLCTEMRLPGRAWLEFEVEGSPDGSTITQTAVFDPVGLSGRLYWYLLFPIHTLVFGGMLRGIARRAVEDRGDGHHVTPGVLKAS
ncbi:MAG: DUF2867 domain-containing protein [Gemmatimonadales bacterium]|nr:DUF2867 domain-containing protein [Gemmatimonadales bacterium]NIN12971.1 DUF2867 domain-containing protein [Gemmatimonadales bacterium]NIR02646.1 DUF2867 domain-containing protein [Gemmatimonadales bacterium]NIS67222.1 DUF2867 domain-containing protein [Gemmatimonadales bacterium]